MNTSRSSCPSAFSRVGAIHMDTALCSHAHTFLLVESAAAGAKARRQAECAQTLYFQPLLSPTFLQGQQAHLRIQLLHGPGSMVLHVLFLFYV